MGRRGKSKKQSITNVDAGSGEEENIPVRRRGRPQKPLKHEIDEEEEEVEKIIKIEEEEDEEEESESAKSYVSNKDSKKQSAAKRKRGSSQTKENSVSIKVENGVVGSKSDGLKAVGFRQNGSRRKNKPRRAAEVGVECK